MRRAHSRIGAPERPRGGVVTQRSAKPCTPVQFRAWPPINSTTYDHTKDRAQIASVIREYLKPPTYCPSATVHLDAATQYVSGNKCRSLMSSNPSEETPFPFGGK